MDRPALILSSDHARLGRDSRDLARQAEAGQLRRIRPGVYVRAEEWGAPTPPAGGPGPASGAMQSTWERCISRNVTGFW
ncbi:MAG: hypothetical protein JWO34_1264 [Arthrobacter sp.]|nr:hypothetical protein [Arthrobacter sp.]